MMNKDRLNNILMTILTIITLLGTLGMYIGLFFFYKDIDWFWIVAWVMWCIIVWQLEKRRIKNEL